MYLLDTNVVSEIRKVRKNKANKNVVEWLSHVQKESLYTNAVVLMEIERGILRMAHKDPQQAERLKSWYHAAIKPMFYGRVLPIDEATATVCSTLHFPDLAPENDAWIAASAIQYDLTLVTRNTKDFEHPNLRVLNPFEA
ncbi:type II toxin-antitoxin system VapC family toxin [Leucothrix pacifica]|uniref:VapC toxin family PIN domain ribonuclease n=1 Tax=Leucothrix pacifica TaxID=1247513 RepID=A0A317CQW0_9GAMM|nr:type II toxin-antitoxin system VapC family toxin [Leucothrix pacifica]PWQ98672.1 VapC toxin family PIN domain ribonuclease [Leucothrix pacifica]